MLPKIYDKNQFLSDLSQLLVVVLIMKWQVFCGFLINRYTLIFLKRNLLTK